MPAAQPRGPVPDRREEILAATLRVIAGGGIDSVTHRRVAAEAGVALGSTTYHFTSRDDLLREAFRHHASRSLGWLAGLAGEIPVGSPDQVVEFLVEVARREFEHPALVLVEYELILRAARDPGLAGELRGFERVLAGRLAEILERLGAAQPFDASRTLISVVRGFELERLTQPDADLVDLRRRLVPVVAALVGASRAARGTRARRSTDRKS